MVELAVRELQGRFLALQTRDQVGVLGALPAQTAVNLVMGLMVLSLYNGTATRSAINQHHALIPARSQDVLHLILTFAVALEPTSLRVYMLNVNHARQGRMDMGRVQSAISVMLEHISQPHAPVHACHALLEPSPQLLDPIIARSVRQGHTKQALEWQTVCPAQPEHIPLDWP